MTTTFCVLYLAGTFGAFMWGRATMRAKWHQFMADAFRIMNDQVTARGMADATVDDLTCSAADVSRAFGSMRAGVE